MIVAGEDPPSPPYSYLPCVCWGARTRNGVEVRHLKAKGSITKDVSFENVQVIGIILLNHVCC